MNFQAKTIEYEEKTALWLIMKPRITKKYFDVLCKNNHIYKYMKVRNRRPYSFEATWHENPNDD